jgi:hypothetical protein
MYLASTSQISDVQKGSQRKKEASNTFVFRSYGNVESGRGLLLCQFRLVIRAKSQQSKTEGGLYISKDTKRLSS